MADAAPIHNTVPSDEERIAIAVLVLFAERSKVESFKGIPLQHARKLVQQYLDRGKRLNATGGEG